jgi:hypothetical protein
VQSRKFLPNLSCVAAVGDYLWTASDEMRTIECLAVSRGGYRLHAQYRLDDLFLDLPGAESEHEADIEALAVADGRLWICGSHSLTRRSQSKTQSDLVDAKIRKRPSRRLLGAVRLARDGGTIKGRGRALPFEGGGSLRAALGGSPYLAPFMDLPSKENGFDIEGLCVLRRRLYIGLRGPVVDNIALVATASIGGGQLIDTSSLRLNFIDLGGLGVRDLTLWKGALLILAGPVSSADGPFQLWLWHPRQLPIIQAARMVHAFPTGPDHPEGMCPRKAGRMGLLVVYDTTNRKRKHGKRYQADWLAL